MKFDDFMKMLVKIDPSLQKEEVYYIFDKLDVNHDSEIDFGEFENFLKENYIETTISENATNAIKRL